MLTPSAISCSSTEAMLDRSMSGTGDSLRERKVVSVYRRKHLPGASRPARPLRGMEGWGEKSMFEETVGTHAYTRTHARTHTHTHTHVHAHTHTHAHARTHMHPHTHSVTHTLTVSHTHAHTHTLPSLPPPSLCLTLALHLPLFFSLSFSIFLSLPLHLS